MSRNTTRRDPEADGMVRSGDGKVTGLRTWVCPGIVGQSGPICMTVISKERV
jgi:hypothetical protein